MDRKRASDEVKTWWELNFDESAYKFRKMDRHHVDLGFHCYDPPRVVQQVRGHPRTPAQEENIQDVIMRE
jgi:hypothetical protein